MSQIKYLDSVQTQALINEIKARLATKNKVFQLAEMPTLTNENISNYVNNSYQYVGATTASYTNGAFYVADSVNLVWIKTTYSKEEIDARLVQATHLIYASELPTTNIDTSAIYLVPTRETKSGYSDVTNDLFYVQKATNDYYKFDSTDGSYIEEVTGNDGEAVAQAIAAGTYAPAQLEVTWGSVDGTKDEFTYDTVDSKWEKIGSTDIDLSNYVQYSDLVAITAAELEAMWNN